MVNRSMDSGTLPRRPLGRTGLKVSPLGLAGSYGIDADAAERAFHELGINYFFVTPRMKGLAEGVRRLVRAGPLDPSRMEEVRRFGDAVHARPRIPLSFRGRRT